ncbi:hypothetical protein Tco_0230278, partial [Tanacetum coccineum]
DAQGTCLEIIAHLLDFKDFDGGYVTFGGGAYGGRITRKGTINVADLLTKGFDAGRFQYLVSSIGMLNP